MPTAQPSAKPTAMPTVTPSVQPTITPPLDCTVACVIQDNAVPISTDTMLRTVTLPPYFTVTFDVLGPALADPNNGYGPRNVFEIADSAGNTVISVATQQTRSLLVVHNNIVVAELSTPALVPAFTSAWTTVTITVKPFSLDFFTSANISDVFQTDLDADVITQNKVFSVLASNNYDDSSFGSIRNVTITGKLHTMLRYKLVEYCLFYTLPT